MKLKVNSGNTHWYLNTRFPYLSAGKRPATDDEMVTSSSNASEESANYDSRRGVWSPGGVLSDVSEVKIKTEVMDTTDALEHCNIEETSSSQTQTSSLVTPPVRSPGVESASTPSREPSPQNPQDAIDSMNATAAQNKRRRIAPTPSNKNKSLEEELCSICGDRASGYHYNALSCEGCKGKSFYFPHWNPHACIMKRG